MVRVLFTGIVLLGVFSMKIMAGQFTPKLGAFSAFAYIHSVNGTETQQCLAVKINHDEWLTSKSCLGENQETELVTRESVPLQLSARVDSLRTSLYPEGIISLVLTHSELAEHIKPQPILPETYFGKGVFRAVRVFSDSSTNFYSPAVLAGYEPLASGFYISSNTLFPRKSEFLLKVSGERIFLVGIKSGNQPVFNSVHPHRKNKKPASISERELGSGNNSSANSNNQDNTYRRLVNTAGGVVVSILIIAMEFFAGFSAFNCTINPVISNLARIACYFGNIATLGTVYGMTKLCIKCHRR